MADAKISELHRKIARKLLDAVYSTVGEDGIRSSFIVQSPEAPVNFGGISATIFFRRSLVLEAAMMLRREGPAFYRHLSVAVAQEELQDVLMSNFWHIGSPMILETPEGSLLSLVKAPEIDLLAGHLASSPIFSPVSVTTLFPLVPLTVEADFIGETFALMRPENLINVLPSKFGAALAPDRFPPFRGEPANSKSPNAWLVLKVPHRRTGRKLSSAVLGGLALSLRNSYRHQFTGREVFGGQCQLTTAGYVLNDREALIPPIGENIVIRSIDHDWLRMLDRKLDSNDNTDIRQIKALQYYYRGWSLDDAERFPINCMALDSLLGEDGAATESVMRGVRTVCGEQVEWERLSLLMRLRGSVMHGGAPDVYESRKYAKYISTYGDDPIDDLELVVTESLRRAIFGDSFVEQDDPYAQIMEAERELGNIPAASFSKSILG